MKRKTSIAKPAQKPRQITAISSMAPVPTSEREAAAIAAISAADECIKFYKEYLALLDRYRPTPERAFYQARNEFHCEHGRMGVSYQGGEFEIVDKPYNRYAEEREQKARSS